MNDKITINDVARRANVAKSTVSRVFTPGESVSARTRKKVEKAARELGYAPDPLARAFSTSVTRTIGVVVPNTESIHISQIIRGIQSSLARKGYAVITVDSSENFGVRTEVKKPLSNQLVDGIINCYSSATEEIIELSNRKPVVCVGDRPQGYRADYVGIDHEKGSALIAKHLWRLGHRKIKLVSGQRDIATEKKSRMFKKTACEIGFLMEDEDCYFANWTPHSGYLAMKEILQSDHMPDAVVFASDMVAFGALKKLEQQGVQVPKDMSICGMDDSMTSKYMIPSLTTLRFSPFKMGIEAGKMMLHRLSGEKDEIDHSVILPVDLELRESTGNRKD